MSLELEDMDVDPKEIKTMLFRIIFQTAEADLLRLQIIASEFNYDFADSKLKNFELLSIALTLEHPDVAEWLIEQGCPVHGEFNEAPLHMAIEKSYNDLVHIMLERGARPEVLYGRGRIKKTALDVALETRNFEAVKIILASAQPNIVNIHNGYDCTALHLAVFHNCLPIFQQLLKCNPNLETRTGKDFHLPYCTALHLAMHLNSRVDQRIFVALLEAGADVNATVFFFDYLEIDNKYYTPIDFSISQQIYGVAKILLSMQNTKINNQSPYLESQFDYMIDKQKPEFIEYAVLLQSMKKFVSPDFLNILYQFCNFEQIQESCLSEIEKMKKTKILRDVTFYDLLTKQPNALVAYTCNQEFIQTFNLHQDKFPLYKKKLNDQIKIAKRIANLLENCHLIFSKFFPFVVCQKVFDYLDIQDLVNIYNINSSINGGTSLNLILLTDSYFL